MRRELFSHTCGIAGHDMFWSGLRIRPRSSSVGRIGGSIELLDMAPSGQGVRMVGAEDPLLLGQQLLVKTQRVRRIPALAGPVGDVATGGQGARILGAEDPLKVGQQLLIQAQRLRGVSALAGPASDVVRVVRVSGWSVPRTRSWSGSSCS